ncbi:MAG: hypothetical protein M0Q91_06320 [Methanoregula sp.]|nr:hypothetical protein [Methanoregula sp.]
MTAVTVILEILSINTALISSQFCRIFIDRKSQVPNHGCEVKGGIFLI